MPVSPLPSQPHATSSNTAVDLYAKVNKTLQERNSVAAKLGNELANDRTKLSGLGQLHSALESFKASAKAVAGGGLDAAATSSANNVLSATGSSTAVAGSYAITVNQLAQSQVLTSKAVTSASAPIGVGASATVKFEFGSVNGKEFSANTAKGAQSVMIHSGDNSLNGVATAINEAAIGVKAKVVGAAGGGFSLSLTSESGSANTLRISVSGDAGLQSLLNYNPGGGKGLTQTAAAQDASLSVNGKAVTSQSNAVTDAVTGVTLNLGAKGAANLVLARDNAQIAKNVGNLVSSYNTLNSKLRSLQQTESKVEGTAARVQTQLARNFAPDTSGAVDPSALTLEKIGITRAKNGDLALDAAKLQAAVGLDAAGVSKLFSNKGGGLADSLVRQIDDMVGPNGSVRREEASVTRDISSLSAKKGRLSSALAAQAAALVGQYSRQSQSVNAAQPVGAAPATQPTPAQSVGSLLNTFG